MSRILSQEGYSLFELIAVIMIISIMAAVAIGTLKQSDDVVRVQKTKVELGQLALAMAGDPNRTSGGARTDFGYVGDIGSLPPNLDALVINPGGYATWNGPYIRDDFYSSSGSAESEFKIDEWGTVYSYAAGNTITSTGSGSNITRSISNSVADLLYNPINIVLTDLDDDPPGTSYADSAVIAITYPNGAGGNTTTAKNMGADGFVSFDSIPIGVHTLQIVYLPTSDTLTRRLTVEPSATINIPIRWHSDLW